MIGNNLFSSILNVLLENDQSQNMERVKAAGIIAVAADAIESVAPEKEIVKRSDPVSNALKIVTLPYEPWRKEIFSE